MDRSQTLSAISKRPIGASNHPRFTTLSKLGKMSPTHPPVFVHAHSPALCCSSRLYEDEREAVGAQHLLELRSQRRVGDHDVRRGKWGQWDHGGVAELAVVGDDDDLA